MITNLPETSSLKQTSFPKFSKHLFFTPTVSHSFLFTISQLLNPKKEISSTAVRYHTFLSNNHQPTMKNSIQGA